MKIGYIETFLHLLRQNIRIFISQKRLFDGKLTFLFRKFQNPINSFFADVCSWQNLRRPKLPKNSMLFPCWAQNKIYKKEIVWKAVAQLWQRLLLVVIVAIPSSLSLAKSISLLRTLTIDLCDQTRLSISALSIRTKRRVYDFNMIKNWWFFLLLSWVKRGNKVFPCRA